jgi:hypothetical protein
MQNEKLDKSKQLYEMADEELREHVGEYLENSRKLIAKGTSTSIEEVQSQQNAHLNDTRISWFREEISKKTKFDQGKPRTFSKVELTEIEEINALLDAQKLQLYADDYRRTKYGMTLGMSRMSLDAVGRLSHLLETETIPRLHQAWDWGGDSGQKEEVLSQLREVLRSVSDVRRPRDLG